MPRTMYVHSSSPHHLRVRPHQTTLHRQVELYPPSRISERSQSATATQSIAA
jgi:hypothetical protein